MYISIALNIILALLLTTVTSYYLKVANENRMLKTLKPRDYWLIKERIKLADPREFEYIVASLYSMLGFKTEVTKASKDGGKDIIIRNTENEYIFVECKHWKDCIKEDINEEDAYSSSCITQDIAQKLRGAMDYGFDGKTPIKNGIIVTTTRFSEQCKTYCKAMNIKMVDIDGIMDMVKQIGTEKVYTAVGIKRDGFLLND